jgi:hypothetical protein
MIPLQHHPIVLVYGQYMSYDRGCHLANRVRLDPEQRLRGSLLIVVGPACCTRRIRFRNIKVEPTASQREIHGCQRGNSSQRKRRRHEERPHDNRPERMRAQEERAQQRKQRPSKSLEKRRRTGGISATRGQQGHRPDRRHERGESGPMRRRAGTMRGGGRRADRRRPRAQQEAMPQTAGGWTRGCKRTGEEEGHGKGRAGATRDRMGGGPAGGVGSSGTRSRGGGGHEAMWQPACIKCCDEYLIFLRFISGPLPSS